MHRDMGQPSAVEALLPPTLGQNQRLERIAAAVDWAPIGQLVATIYAAPVGRPSYPPLLLVKALLLAQWYDLSDPQLEEALSDRRSFRRFVGLGLQDDTPDHARISRFRRVLAQRELSAGPLCGSDAPVGAAGPGAEAGDLAGHDRGGPPRCAARPGRAGPGGQECNGSRRRLDLQWAGRPDALRLQGASGGGPGVVAGAPGRADTGESVRERGGRCVGVWG